MTEANVGTVVGVLAKIEQLFSDGVSQSHEDLGFAPPLEGASIGSLLSSSQSSGPKSENDSFEPS
jgi:hypothetical protein